MLLLKVTNLVLKFPQQSQVKVETVKCIKVGDKVSKGDLILKYHFLQMMHFSRKK